MHNASSKPEHTTPVLHKSLGALHLWSLAVGLVISGEYFGWSYGWSVSGPLGFLVATITIALLYITLIFSFTELTTSIPSAGGPYAYAERAYGKWVGLIAGIATTVEFLFAPPAIAFALGSYTHVLFPEISIPWAATLVLFIFGIINLLPVKQSARFELIVTLIAVVELLLFLAAVGPHFQWSNFSADGWHGGVSGIFASLPYAIWFFLAIEGVAMSAEETKNPSRDIPRGYISGILTLVVLALGVMLAAGGAGDWKKLSQMDYPIPGAVEMALGVTHPWVKLFAGIGLFGLIASLNGIVFGSSRQIFAVARAGLLPSRLAQVNRFGVPALAVVVTTLFGIASIWSGTTSQLITLSAFGAVTMYAISMVSLFKLRQKEPKLLRPFKAPLYPVFPAIALLLSLVSLLTMAYYNPYMGCIYLVILVGTTLGYFVTHVIRKKNL